MEVHYFTQQEQNCTLIGTAGQNSELDYILNSN